jgi:methyl-accepting chemotaxis protein
VTQTTWLIIFVGVTALAFCVQMVVMILLYKAIEKSSARMESIVGRFEERSGPVLTTAQAILEDAQPKIAEITSNLADASSTVRAHVAVVAEATGEIVERARMQAARLDNLIHETAEKIESTTDFLQNSVVTPVRRVHAILQAVNAGLGFFKRHRARKKAVHQMGTEQDEEMFI